MVARRWWRRTVLVGSGVVVVVVSLLFLLHAHDVERGAEGEFRPDPLPQDGTRAVAPSVLSELGSEIGSASGAAPEARSPAQGVGQPIEPTAGTRSRIAPEKAREREPGKQLHDAQFEAELVKAIAAVRDLGPEAVAALLDTISRADESQRAVALHKLSERLRSAESATVRRTIALCLGMFGVDAVGPLLHALDGDPDESVREAAADALGWTGSESTLQHLYHAVYKDKDAFGRIGRVGEMAIGAIGRIGGRSAAELLMRMWKDEEIPRSSKTTVLSALGLAGHAIGLEVVEKALTATEYAMRSRAAYALAEIGSCNGDDPGVAGRVRASLRRCLRDKNPEVREKAAYGLAWVGVSQDLALLRVLVEKDAYQTEIEYTKNGQIVKQARYPVRENAERAIREIERRLASRRRATHSPRGQPGPREQLGQRSEVRNPELEAELEAAVSTLRRSDSKALARLSSRINSLDRDGRAVALRILSRRLESDQDPEVRIVCAFTLKALGHHAVGPLVRALHADPDDDVCRCAAYTLGMVGSERELHHLLRTVQGETNVLGHIGKIGQTALRSIARIGGSKAAVLLTNLWKDSKLSRESRMRVVSAMAAAGHRDCLNVAENVLGTTDDEGVRVKAAYVVAQIGGRNRDDPQVVGRTRALLRKCLQDRNPSVRENGACGLAWIGNSDDLKALQLLLERDPYERKLRFRKDGRWVSETRRPVRDMAEWAIGRIQSRLASQKTPYPSQR